MDLTDAEYYDDKKNKKTDEIILELLGENDRHSIFNVMILEEDKENSDGK